MSREDDLRRTIAAYHRRADDAGRDLTNTEQWAVAGMINELERLEGKSLGGNPLAGYAEITDALGRQLGGGRNVPGDGSWIGPPFGGFASSAGPGDVFVSSPEWKALADPDKRGQSWKTNPVEVPSFQTKAGTLLESGQGAGLIPVPQVVPGVVSTLFEPLGVADLFQQGVATDASIRYVVEGTAVSGAAGVPEGGEKPASDLTLSTVDEKLTKIATVLSMSDEIVEDESALTAYLNSRLLLFVRMEEDRELLRGAGAGSSEILGMFGREGINQYSRLAGDDNAVCLARVLADTAGSAYLQPDTIVMHPSNWLTTRLLRDGTGGTAGQFYGSGPFGYSYGGAVSPGLFGQRLWDTPVFLSTVVGPGTALVGSFKQGAQLFRRGGPTIQISNSHADYFKYDLVMIRCEERAALAVYRPGAFTEVRGLT